MDNKVSHPRHTADLYELIGKIAWFEYGRGSLRGKIMDYDWEAKRFLIIMDEGYRSQVNEAWFYRG